MIGLRQNYYENRINTIIPFSENTLKIPYKVNRNWKYKRKNF
jgi:hypothetical protein